MKDPPLITEKKKNHQKTLPTTNGKELGGEGTQPLYRGNKNINEYLSTKYYDPLQPASYSGLQKFWNAIKYDNVYNLNYKQVKQWLKKQEGYVRHQPAPRVFPRQKILMSSLDEMWDADLLDMQKYARQNNGYRFLAVFIDIFSRYIWVEPLKTKKNDAVLRAIQRIF
jgi:hypothetical protein